jgi:hypothetical protein
MSMFKCSGKVLMEDFGEGLKTNKEFVPSFIV